VAQLQSGEPVSVAIKGLVVQAGTFLRDMPDGRVEVWVGSRARIVRRDQINPTTLPSPIKTYESLFGSDD
jgi:hypothetical protein